jgi:asparagine synthase (glutamine-hydrolysing)
MKVLNEKYILKKAAGHLVPATVRNRPKQPYRAPDANSFFDTKSQRARCEYVDTLLSRRRIEKDGLFNAAAVERLVNKARKGQAIGTKDSMALVGIISTQLLKEQFIGA